MLQDMEGIPALGSDLNDTIAVGQGDASGN
jgi:hypothetical protein